MFRFLLNQTLSLRNRIPDRSDFVFAPFLDITLSSVLSGQVIETLLAEHLPAMRPILLLDMHIVVLLAGTRTGEGGLGRMRAEIAQQMTVEKLAAL